MKDEDINKIYIYKVKYYFFKKEDFSMCCSVVEFGRCYIKWNMLVRKE